MFDQPQKEKHMTLHETTEIRELKDDELDNISGAWLVSLWSLASSAAAVAAGGALLAYGMMVHARQH
jgi:hypothetical protein